MSTFDDTGLVVDRLQDIYDDFLTELRSKWGSNVVDDVQSLLGTVLYQFANLLGDVNESLEDVVSNLNPNTATGAALSKIVLLNGLTRNASAYSTVSLNCTANGSVAATIPAGTLVTDTSETVIFATDTTTAVPAGTTVSISATATEAGPFTAQAGTLTVIKTPVYAFESVTNPASSTTGNYEETDGELRARRNLVVSQSGSSSIAAIYSLLTEVTNVEDVAVYENATATTDAKGIPPYHIWAIVDGGSDTDVAAALFQTSAGKGYHGTTTVSYTPTPDTGGPYDITFSRPTDVDVWVTVNVTADISTFPSDGADQISDALLEYWNGTHTIEGIDQPKFGFGDDVILSKLYSPIYSVPGHYVTSLYADTSPSPSSTSNISIGYDQRAYTDATQIVVNVTYA